MIHEIEGLETKRQAVALANPEALVRRKIPILLRRPGDYVAPRVADHALRPNHDGCGVEPLAGSRIVKLQRLTGRVRTRAILQRQRVSRSREIADQAALERDN